MPKKSHQKQSKKRRTRKKRSVKSSSACLLVRNGWLMDEGLIDWVLAVITNSEESRALASHPSYLEWKGSAEGIVRAALDDIALHIVEQLEKPFVIREDRTCLFTLASPDFVGVQQLDMLKVTMGVNVVTWQLWATSTSRQESLMQEEGIVSSSQLSPDWPISLGDYLRSIDTEDAFLVRKKLKLETGEKWLQKNGSDDNVLIGSPSPDRAVGEKELAALVERVIPGAKIERRSL